MADISHTRRAALAKLAAVAVAPAALAACKPAPAPNKPSAKPGKRVHDKRKPGYQRRGAMLQTTFRSTFIVDGRKTDPKKRIVHYADAQGRVFGLDTKTKIAAFRAFDPAKDAGAPLSKHRLSYVAETAALENFAPDADGNVTPTHDQCVRACNTLLDAITLTAAKAKRPPYRLFDLAAGVAFRYGLTDAMARLTAVQWPSADNGLSARQQSYQLALAELNGTKPVGAAKHQHRITRWHKHFGSVVWSLSVPQGRTNKVRKIHFGASV